MAPDDFKGEVGDYVSGDTDGAPGLGALVSAADEVREQPADTRTTHQPVERRPPFDPEKITSSIKKLFDHGADLSVYADSSHLTKFVPKVDGLPMKMQALLTKDTKLDILQMQQLRLVGWALQTDRDQIGNANEQAFELAEKIVHWSMNIHGGRIDYLSPEDAFHLFTLGQRERDTRIANTVGSMYETVMSGAFDDIHDSRVHAKGLEAVALATKNIRNASTNLLRELGVSEDTHISDIYQDPLDPKQHRKEGRSKEDDKEGRTLASKNLTPRMKLERDFILTQVAAAWASVHLEMQPNMHVQPDRLEGDSSRVKLGHWNEEKQILEPLTHDEEYVLEGKLARLQDWVEFAGRMGVDCDKRTHADIEARFLDMIGAKGETITTPSLIVTGSTEVVAKKDVHLGSGKRIYPEWDRTLKAIEKLEYTREIPSSLMTRKETEVTQELFPAGGLAIGRFKEALEPLTLDRAENGRGRAYLKALGAEYTNHFDREPPPPDAIIPKTTLMPKGIEFSTLHKNAKSLIGKAMSHVRQGIADEHKELIERATGNPAGSGPTGSPHVREELARRAQSADELQAITSGKLY